MPGTSTQTATITWTDPPVGAGQAALQTLTIYAAVDTAGAAGARVSLGTVGAGVQTFTTTAGQLTNGTMYFFSVQATDVNGQVGPFSANSAAIGPIGAPGAPTNIKAVLN